MEQVHERVIHIRKQADLTQKEFADILGLSQAYVSSLEKGKRELSRNVIEALRKHFNVSSDWLLHGSGTPYRPEGDRSLAVTDAPFTPGGLHIGRYQSIETFLSGKSERIMPITVDAKDNPNIVLVPVKAQAGYALGRVEPEFIQDLPTFSLPDARFRNGTFRAFEISGDSMEPTLFGGDIVVCRHVQDWRWLRDNELYVVVMREDVLVKRVRNRIREQLLVELISDNRFYPPLPVPAEEVLEIWQVAARLTLHLPAPTYPA